MTTRIAKGGKAVYGAPLGILDAGRALSPHPRRHGQRHHLALPRALQSRHRRHPGTRGAGGRGWPTAQLPRRRGRTRGPGRRSHHHQLRLPVAVPGRTRATRRRSRRHQFADAGALGASHPAPRQARRRRHRVRRVADPSPSAGRRRAPRYPGRRHRKRSGILPRADPRPTRSTWTSRAPEQDILDATAQLLSQHTDIGAIVLECTNMPPYAHAVQAKFRLPVYDIYSLITWFHAALRPRRF